ncbi:MAG: hypothetical protein ACI9VT_001030 [Psychroserpens sp.]|jgi:hypothetical protein
MAVKRNIKIYTTTLKATAILQNKYQAIEI